MTPTEDTSPSAPREPSRISFLFRLTAAAVGLFVVTIFSLGADIFGNPNAPVAQFLSRYGTHLIIGEVVLIVILGIAAMCSDKTPPLQPHHDSSTTEDGSAESPGENPTSF